MFAQPKQKKKKKYKEVWLKTPFGQKVYNEDGTIKTDAEGNPYEIPLCVCMPANEAARLIKKKKREAKVDPETGDLQATADYMRATDEEIEAHLVENAKYTKRRGAVIHKRQLKNSKAFVMVSSEEMGKATGVTPQKEFSPGPSATTDSGGEDVVTEPDPFEELKQRAAELGITYPPNIKEETLRKKIEEADRK